MNNLKKIRESKKLTLEQAGKLVGTSYQQVHRLENDQIKLTVNWMERFSKAYGVTVSEILNLSGGKQEIPVQSYVGAGAEIFCGVADEPAEFVSLPPGESPTR